MLDWVLGNERAPARQRVEPVIGNLADGETVSSSDIRMFEIFGEGRTPAGAAVTDKTAMRVSAVYSCVSLIAGSIAMLPLPVYERDGETRVRADHDYWWMLNEQPCSAWTSQAYWEFMLTQMLLRADGISYLARNRAGAVTGIIPWPRSKVGIERVLTGNPKDPVQLRYFFQDEQGYFGAHQDDVLHFPGFGFDGCKSMSVIQWGARNGIGIAIKGDEHAGQFFSQGGKPEVAIQAKGEMKPKQQEEFREAWVRKYSGNGPNAIPLILTEGLDIKELTMSAVDQQLLESRQWQVIDIARAFRVPPHMIGETTKTTSWGSGLEQQSIGFVQYTLGPHLNRIKQELNRKLFRTSRYFVEHNVDGLLAGDSKAQAEYFGKALGGPGAQGWMTVNEVRRLKNLPPVPGGNELYQPDPNHNPAPGGGSQETTNEDPQAAAAGA